MASVDGVKVTKITATSRVAVKIKDNYYTVEFSEERSVPEMSPDSTFIDEERANLFEDVNTVVDNQVQEILETFRK